MEITVAAPDVHVAAAPEEVWDVLADFSAHPEWTPQFRLRGRTAEPGARVTVVARVLPGPPLVLPAVVLRSERGRVLSWGGRMGGLLRLDHAFELTPVEGGTRVSHREVFEGIGAAPVRLVRSRLRDQYTRMSHQLRTRTESLVA